MDNRITNHTHPWCTKTRKIGCQISQQQIGNGRTSIEAKVTSHWVISVAIVPPKITSGTTQECITHTLNSLSTITVLGRCRKRIRAIGCPIRKGMTHPVPNGFTMGTTPKGIYTRIPIYGNTRDPNGITVISIRKR